MRSFCLSLLVSVLFWSFFFGATAQGELDCEHMCVTSIAYNPEDDMLYVTIVNGDVQINYPTVQVIVDGDTVANINGEFNLFAQLPGETVTHVIPTELTAVPFDFVCTVTILDQIWDVSCELPFPCIPEGLQEDAIDNIALFPNPAGEFINIRGHDILSLDIYDLPGKWCLSTDMRNHPGSVDISLLPAGQYFVVIRRTSSTRFVHLAKVEE